jgi:hypothetical protein
MAHHAGLKTQGFSQGIYEQSVNQKEELDTVRILSDGRMFAYARAGASDLAAGYLTQTAIATDNAHNEAITASAVVGDTILTVTFGGAVTVDFFKDGYMWVNDEAGEGHGYRVKGHPAGQASVPVTLKDPVRVALTAATSEISFLQNRQDLVIVQPYAALTGAVIGVPPIPITAYYYFWNQVKGWCPIYVVATVVIGEEVAPTNGSTAGGAEALIHATTWDTTIGTTLRVNANSEFSLINLAISGY